jgi:hypothetical protein
MLRRTVAASTAIALTAVAAPLPMATAATSDKSFKKQANAICKVAGEGVEKLPKITDDNALQVLTAEVKIANALVKGLKKIDPPASKAAKYKSFIAATKEQATYVDKMLDAAKAKQSDAKIEALAKKADATGKRGNKIAKQLKLSDCAKSYEAGGGSSS